MFLDDLCVLGFNDLIALDLSESTDWEVWLPNDAYPDRPLARADHTMISWDEKLYL